MQTPDLAALQTYLGETPDTAAPLALDCCACCRFFLADSRRQGAAAAGTLDRRSARAAAGGGELGTCRRMPQSLRKPVSEWCGEFARRPAR